MDLSGVSEASYASSSKGAHDIRAGNGGDCHMTRPFMIIATWPGVVLVKCRASIVPNAQVTRGIGIMYPCRGIRVACL